MDSETKVIKNNHCLAVLKWMKWKSPVNEYLPNGF